MQLEALILISIILVLLLVLLVLFIIPIILYFSKFNTLVEFWKQRWKAENLLLVKAKKKLNQLKYANNSKNSS